MRSHFIDALLFDFHQTWTPMKKEDKIRRWNTDCNRFNQTKPSFVICLTITFFWYMITVCECDIRGIVESNGCNQEDGRCSCKRNVVNRNCDQCAEEHYGLSESDPLGCKPCDCDIGKFCKSYITEPDFWPWFKDNWNIQSWTFAYILIVPTK